MTILDTTIDMTAPLAPTRPVPTPSERAALAAARIKAAPPAAAVTPRTVAKGRAWRLTVVIYAAALLVVLGQWKAEFASAFTSSPLLIVYGLAVTAYLSTRMVLAVIYRPVPVAAPTADLPHVTVVVPTFNEEDRIEATIASLFSCDYPAGKLAVIAIDDGSSDRSWERIQVAARRHPDLKALRFSRNRGKRAAMAAGIRAAAGTDVILFVDSDSTIASDGVRAIVAPMLGERGAKVHGVTGQADVLNAGVNLLTRLQQVRYFAAFRIVKAAESVFGKVSCASGCFSAYRYDALLAVLRAWETQTFLGRESTFGDDRALTNDILARGGDVVYQSNAICGTAVPEKWCAFLRQQLRWKKSWTRESLRVMGHAWRWNPIAAAAMYASIVFQVIGPMVAFHALVWRPLTGGNGWTYLVGLHLMAVLYGLYYAYVRRSPHWWGGVLFGLVYSAVLCWQTYWAMLASRNTSWGTRASSYDDAGELAISERIGATAPCGLPERLTTPPLLVTEASVSTLPSAALKTCEPVTGRDWAVGIMALPVTAAPILTWLTLS